MTRIKIKRKIPSLIKRKKYSIEEIIKAAKKVKDAIDREEKRYGKLEYF